MKATYDSKRDLSTTVRVALFLARREIRRANVWTTALIVAVMVLTFLNLIVVSGILVGLIQGSVVAYKDHYLGDVFISTLPQKQYIENTTGILASMRGIPEIVDVSARYTTGGRLEANYRTRTRQTDLIDSIGASVAGIDPEAEDRLTGLSGKLVDGEYLAPNDYDNVLVGATLLYKYTQIEESNLRPLKDVDVGSKIRLVIGTSSREVTIKGVVKSKVGEVDQRVFMTDTQLRGLINRYDYNVDEIAVRIAPGASPEKVRDAIKASGADSRAMVRTAAEAEPKFVKDIESTFAILGNLIGSVGLAVACITIFIVIFVNAITRRRYIGIMKGIGVSSRSIELSYVIQSLFYAACGIAIGLAVVFFGLKPYMDANPIDFPFSDGILVATPVGTAVRVAVLMLATIVAGYIPARIVVKQNTLNAILGR